MATFSQKALLLKDLLSGEIAYTGPFHAMIDLTRRYNLHCIGCRFHFPVVYRPSPSDPGIQDMDWDLYESLCRQLHETGTRVIFLMGEGEPLLHPGIFRMTAFAKKLGFHAAIIFNGTLVNAGAAHELVSSGLDLFQVSLWALNETDYAAQHPGTSRENFSRVLEGLRQLSMEKQKRYSRSPSIILHHPINSRNMQAVETITGLACETGCDGISLSPYSHEWKVCGLYFRQWPRSRG
ncbi:MAG: radical SAM protein [Acidobacteria bacterium]|nr:radical SAM protein [Acidobacteriota bacterium]